MNRYQVEAIGAFHVALRDRNFVYMPEGDTEYWSKQNVTLYWEPNSHGVPVYHVMVTAEFGDLAGAVYSTLSHREALNLATLLEREVNA